VWGGSGYAFTGLADLQTKAGLNEVTIAFVLSNGGCNTTQDVEQNLGDVKAFLAAGGHVKASFGGADGTYVESQCHDANSLATAIEGFVDATGITDLDFDIEQDPMLTDTVNAMRAQALKAVQDSKGIRVAFTLQANPPPGGGLTSQGQSVVSHALAAGVKISHVNLMTMDYGDSFGGQPLAPVVTGTLSDAQAQIMNLVPGISSQQAWAMVGVIPMIGKNDDAEVFSLSDAQSVEQFAKQNGVGLVSFWSIDRDQPGTDFNTSSTVESTNFAFNAILQAVTK
jgi:chitinase